MSIASLCKCEQLFCDDITGTQQVVVNCGFSIIYNFYYVGYQLFTVNYHKLADPTLDPFFLKTTLLPPSCNKVLLKMATNCE